MKVNMQELQALMTTVGIVAEEQQIKGLMERLQSKKPKSQAKYQVLKTDFEAKTPMQMKQCVLALAEAARDDEPVDMKMWAELLEQYEGFKTVQTPEKIIAFYRKRMLDEGLVAAV